MLPRYLSGVRMRARMTGSSIFRDLLGIGKLGGVLDVDRLARRGGHTVVDARGRRYEAQLEIPLQPFLDDLPMEEAEKPGPEPEAEGGRVLRLIMERGVVQPELLQGVPEVLDAALPRREHAAEDHGLGLLESRQGLSGRALFEGDRLPDPGVAQLLDPRDDVTDLAREEP